MSWSHLNLFVGSDLFYDTTIYFLYIAFGFFLIPMEHNFMEKKNTTAFVVNLDELIIVKKIICLIE